MIIGAIPPGSPVLSAEEIRSLACLGCDFIVLHTSFESYTGIWVEGVAGLHAHGIKVFLRWPTYGADLPISVDDPQYCCHNHVGRTNAGYGGKLEQFSPWNDEVANILFEDLKRWVEQGPPIDGIHVTVATCDRMFPTDWYGTEYVAGSRTFWSFDDSAQEKWAAYSNDPMPTHPIPDGGPEMDQFYVWYRKGYIDRLTHLSNMIVDRGINQLSTWFLPHNRFTVENMAGGTAGAVEPLNEWYNWIIARTSGVKPIMIVANHFPLRDDWPEWFADGKETIERVCASPYNWDLIVGADAAYESFLVAPNFRGHGRQTAEMGGKGLFMATSIWLGNPQWEPGVIEAAQETAKLFD